MWEPEEGNSSEYHITFVDTIQDMEAWCRKDGCFELKSWYNDDKGNFDQIHICDIDVLIRQLQELKEKAGKYFGGEWPER